MSRGRRTRGLPALMLASVLVVPGCGGALVRLANHEDWTELDRRARAMSREPHGKAARAWAQALVELDQVDEARALLLRDYRHGGQTASLLALAALEQREGLHGISAAHYTRAVNLDLDDVQRDPELATVCDLLRARARAEAALGEALAADTDMRRVALVCPESIDDDDRGFLSSVEPAAQAQAEGQRTLASAVGAAEPGEDLDTQLRERLELARKRSARALIGVAEAERVQLEAEDIAGLLAAEFAGTLGPGFVTSRRLSAWIGDNPVSKLVAAIEGLPDGIREYALLRVSGVRRLDRATSERQSWVVAAMAAVAGQGPHEAAKGWRVAATVGNLSGAEFALNTNLRDMIPAAPVNPGAAAAGGAGAGELVAAPTNLHWSRRVPVDRRSFDLLLTLARLFELRDQPVLALELRRSVIVAGYEVGLAQVGPAAAEEVLRQLALGRPWQALALAEVVPGPLLDEVLPAVAAGLVLGSSTTTLDEAIAGDRNVVWRALGDPWFEAWDPRIAAARGGLQLRGTLDATRGCPGLGDWLDAGQSEALARVGLDPAASRAALTAAATELGSPETGSLLIRAIEADLGLACSAPMVELLHAGPHLLALASLDERLTYAPELGASTQLQLAAEVAAASGAGPRALSLTISAAAESVDPRGVWARAATAGRSFGLREYTLEALRQVVLHSPGLDDPAALREILLIRLRDVNVDPVLRSDDPKPVESIQAELRRHVDEAPAIRRWDRLDQLLWAIAADQPVDSIAATKLAEILAPVLEGDTAERHPAAVAAVQARLSVSESALDASEPASHSTSAVATGGLPELAYLSDADAICEQTGTPDLDPQRLLGAALACGPRVRAEALAALLQSVPEADRALLRSQILQGSIAAEIEPDRPGVLRSVPALVHPDLGLRISFELGLEPIWLTTASTAP